MIKAFLQGLWEPFVHLLYHSISQVDMSAPVMHDFLAALSDPCPALQ